MKTTLIILLVIAVGVTLLFVALGMLSRSGTSPGLVHGRLAACPDRPNCLCSEYPEDRGHYVQPLQMPSVTSREALGLLSGIIGEMGGTVLVAHGGYLAATFRSPMFGFVDDLELRIDGDGQQIHIRAGSRVGYSDGGVNGTRIEQLRKRLSEQRATE